MLKLKKVTLMNLRSHKFFEFTPSEEGITAISGPNGAGKSTLVDSIAWTLYGTKPEGVSKITSIVKDGVDVSKEECGAIVEIEIDGAEIRVERKVHTWGAGCEVFEDNGSGVMERVAGPAVSHAEPYLRRRLKMDEKGFLAAVLVQQKQVDQLIAAKGRERGRVIEKLVGITSITEALTKAREECNVVKRSAKISNVDEEELVKMEKTKLDLDTKVSELDTKIVVMTQDLISYKKDFEEKEAIAIQLITDHREINTIVNTISVAKASLDSLKKTLSMLQREKERKKSALGNNLSIDVSEIKEKLDAKRRELREIDSELGEKTRRGRSAKLEFQELKKIIEESGLHDIDAAKAAKVALDEFILILREKVSNLAIKKASDQDSIRKIDRAVKAIGSGTGSCPVCLQKVHDPEHAIASLRVEKDGLEVSVKSFEAQNQDLLNELEEKTAKLIKIIEIIDSFTKTPIVVSEINELRVAVVEIKSNHTVVEAQLTSLEKSFSGAQKIVETREEFEILRKEALEASDSLEAAQQVIIENENLLSGRKISNSDLDKAQSQKNIAGNKASRKELELQTSKGEFEVNLVRKQNIEENILKLTASIKKYRDLLKAVEKSTNTAAVIEEFRAERIKISVPAIEAHASELLSRFTEGKFTQLKMDSNFNATAILNDGSKRPVGLLSGGELSAAAMALRLAVSMMLTSGNGSSLIILDEPLVSQDSARAEAILTTIKDVCDGQIILIAHNESLDSIADKVVELS